MAQFQTLPTAGRIGTGPLSIGGQVAYGGQASQFTSMAAPMTTMAAPITTMAPMTTMAAPIMSMAAPQYTSIAAPQQFVQPAVRDLLAMGNVISERVVTIEELAEVGRYEAAEAVEVAPQIVYEAPQVQYIQEPQVQYVVQEPQVQYVEAAPAVEYIQEPQVQYVTGAPQMIQGGQFQTYAGGAFQTMGAPQMIQSQPYQTYAGGMQTIIG